jgi:NNP family nitrate/nitrite transporter-like MFS transporter
MQLPGKAVRIRLGDLHTPPMRAFHMSWLAFFLCFLGWFGIAPLMVVVRDELALSAAQVADTIIASVAITIVARLVVGRLLDRFGPRLVYSALLLLGALPVAGIGLARDFHGLLLCRLAIGAIGASFVITQYHTSLMFAANCVGTANATAAGWGNMGGGVAQIAMPLVMALFVALGASPASGWRLAMLVPAAAMVAAAFAYFLLTQDTPEGNFRELRRRGRLPAGAAAGAFRAAARDPRVWVLFAGYGACFGIELTINNIAALYFHDTFALGLAPAGLVAGSFGLMNLFARSLGGYLGDRAGIAWGLRGRVRLLAAVLLAEGAALVLFSRMNALPAAVVSLLVFSLFVQMSEGATFSVVPFVNRRALGAVAGIVGAGGNAGALAAGFLLRSEGIAVQTTLLYLGLAVAAVALLTPAVRFSPADERQARREIRESLQTRLNAVYARP